MTKSNYNLRYITLSSSAGVPRLIAHFAEHLQNDSDAIQMLHQIKIQCREKDVPMSITDVLKSRDITARIEAIKRFFGEKINLNPQYLADPLSIMDMSWYILNHGNVTENIRHECSIGKGYDMPQSDKRHIRYMRALREDIPVKLAQAFDDIDSDAEFSDMINKLKSIKLDDENLNSTVHSKRLNSLIPIIKDIFPESITDKIRTDFSLSETLCKFILK